MPYVRSLNLWMLPLLATLTACSSAPTAQQEYCDDCLIRKTSDSDASTSDPDLLLLRAQRTVRIATKAEKSKDYTTAYKAWGDLLSILSTLKTAHPNHPTTLRIQKDSKIAGVAVSSVKLDRMSTLSQKILVSSSVIGWARYEVETSNRYQQAEGFMALAGAYFDLGRHKEASDAIERVRSSMSSQQLRWKRQRLDAMQRVIDAQQPMKVTTQSGVVLACILAPSACLVPWNVSEQTLVPKPGIMHSNTYPNYSYRGVRALIDIGEHDVLLELVLRSPEIEVRQRFINTLLHHALTHNDEALLDRLLQLVSSKIVPLGDPAARFELLLGVFSTKKAQKAEKPLMIKMIKAVEQVILSSDDLEWRAQHLAGISLMMLKVNRLSQAKRMAKASLDLLLKHPELQKKHWLTVSTALVQTKQVSAAQPLLARHMASSPLDVWAGMARARIQRNLPQSTSRLDNLTPSVMHFNVLSSVAQTLLSHKKEAQAKPLIEQARTMLASDALQKQDPWILSKMMGKAFALSVLLQDKPRIETELAQIKAFSLDKLPQDGSHAFREIMHPMVQALKTSIVLKRPAIEKLLIKEIKEASTLKKGTYFSSRYAKPVMEAYIDAKRWDDLFTFIDSLPKSRGSASGSHGMVISLLEANDSTTRPPELMKRLKSELISDLSKQKYYSFYNISRFCKIAADKVCVSEMITVARDIDKNNTKSSYANATRSLSRSLVSYKVDGAIALYSDLKSNYDKSYFLSQLLQSWGSDAALRKRNPTLPEQVEAMAKALPSGSSHDLTGARAYTLAVQGKCDKIPELLEEQKKRARYSSSNYESALNICVARQNYIPSLRLVEHLSSNSRTHLLISLGYALEVSGAAKRADVKAELKRITESLFDGNNGDSR